jgi:inner membrane protein
MEPVTHVLTGFCLARTGFNRKTAYATLTMAIAAELPDIDTVWSLRGPVEGFAHHRGITHTFVAMPVEAALLVGSVWLWNRFTRQGSGPRVQGKVRIRVHSASLSWAWLYGCAMVALLSHLLLDYTNNYGVRPFFPFNPRWYAGSFVFIFDPLIFVLLVGALVGPWLFGLVGAEVGVRKKPFRGRGWAVAALSGIVFLWGVRALEHGKAVEMAQAQNIVAPTHQNLKVKQADVIGYVLPQQSENMDASFAPAEPTSVFLQAQRSLASPDPLSPFRWSVVTDFGPVYQMAEVNTREQTLTPGDVLQPKPASTPEFVAAAESPLGRAYLDWSSMPFVTQQNSDDGTVVTLRDPRFLGGWLAEHGHTALMGTVTVDATGRVVEQELDGRMEKDRR